MSSVLWWGRCDRDYSRNKIVANLFLDLGWKVVYYHPLVSQCGFIEAYVRWLAKPDLIWVPCFRQRDIASASFWSGKWKVPLIVDPLISAYEKEIFERNKWPPESNRAKKRRRYEADLFSKADIIVADTPAHATFFKETLHVEPDKLGILCVGADTGMFNPRPFPLLHTPLEILFYGSFLHLQGPDVIVAAARKTRDLEINWILLGDGELRAETEKKAKGLHNVIFEPWIDYKHLPERISKAHILLGIFGTTLKANLVIPNKMFQAMASGRPVITRRSKAYPRAIEDSDTIGWVPAGNPDALASLVRKWLETPAMLKKRGQETRQLFDAFFSKQKLKNQLKVIVQKAIRK